MPAAPAAGGIGSAELKQRVASNVDQVLTRIKNIAPQTFPEEVDLLRVRYLQDYPKIIKTYQNFQIGIYFLLQEYSGAF